MPTSKMRWPLIALLAATALAVGFVVWQWTPWQMAKTPDPGKTNPWQTLSTTLEFENPWFAITTHDTIARQNQPRVERSYRTSGSPSSLPLPSPNATATNPCFS